MLQFLKIRRFYWPTATKFLLSKIKRSNRLSINFVCKALYYSKILKKRQRKIIGSYYLIGARKNNTVTMSKGPTARKKKSLVYFTQFNKKVNIYCFGNFNDEYFISFVSSCAPVLAKHMLNVNYLMI